MHTNARESSLLEQESRGAIQVVLDAAAILSTELICAIDAACDRTEDRGDGAKLVVYLQGAKSHPGNPLWPGEEVSIQLVGRWEKALRRLEQLRSVTIAAADDICGPMALEVLACADCRVAGRDLRLFPGGTGGVWPGMWVHRLAKQIGTAKMRSLLLLGGELSGEMAADAGLVDMVAADLAGAVSVLSKQTHDGHNVAVCRRLLAEALTTTYEQALGTHLAACDRVLRKAQRP